MNARVYDAVVAGYLGVDIAPGFAQREPHSFGELFKPGRLIETEGLYFSLGGVVANTGLAMKKFGREIFLNGCVGSDTLGDIAVSLLDKHGVSQGIRRIDSTGTAYGIVLAPPGADRVFLEDPGCNRVFSANDVDYDIVAQSRLFHFGYPPLMEELWKKDGEQLVSLLQKVRECGTAVSLDMTLPDSTAPAGKADWKKLLANVLPLVDIFTPSIEELLFMLAPRQFAEIAEKAGENNMIDSIPQDVYSTLAETVLGMGVDILLIKAGHTGAYVRASGSKVLNEIHACPDGTWVETFPVDTDRFCNASGAGDCAVAAFLTALLKGSDIVEAGRYAMLAGRDNLYGTDAVSGLRKWQDMIELLNTKYGDK